MRILIVEDNADSALPLKLLLEMEGHSVTHALDGAAAVAAVAQELPDVVLCDLTLPDRDGVELVGDFPEGPTLVALTGHDRATVWARCEKAGFHHHVQKPVDFDSLLALLS